jgi:DNA-binding NtrC family response regulator
MKARRAILIVDDEAIILMALKQELLRRYKGEFILETALDAVEANSVIDELAGEGVRLILVISDWLMPGIKGDEFLAGVKARYPEVRCIIISGQADPVAIERAQGLVALDAFIRKPWDKEELLAAVGACVGGGCDGPA